MKICVLLPDYSTTNVDYQNYDPPRNLQKLLPNDLVDTIFLNKLTTYKQLKNLSKLNYDIFVNLCEGYLEWEVPSIEVIYFLELLNLPFTGSTSLLYDPPKTLMKYVAFTEGIKTPNYLLFTDTIEIEKKIKQLTFPLFIKPSKAGDSLGIDKNSKVDNLIALEKQCNLLLIEYDELLIEEYIVGREFTVLVAANADEKTVKTFMPVEYVFDNKNEFKTYNLKTSELHTDANIACNDKDLEMALRKAALQIFKAFKGKGYARLDFRVTNKNEIFFLEINFTCSVFYDNGYEGSADYILKIDGFGQQNFLDHIIEEGIVRHKNLQKKYTVKGSTTAGFGIFANTEITCNETIFNLEEQPQRLATLQHIEKNWSKPEKENFTKYAYPISSEVYLLWSNNPNDWAPQNHSCNANTAYNGLNVIATQNIKSGDELTLDYATFLDATMEVFKCNCGASNCKEIIKGELNNTITKREIENRNNATINE